VAELEARVAALVTERDELLSRRALEAARATPPRPSSSSPAGVESTSALTRRIRELEATLADTRAQLARELERERGRERDYESALRRMEEEQRFAADEKKHLLTLLETADRGIRTGREQASRRAAELEERVAALVAERDELLSRRALETSAGSAGGGRSRSSPGVGGRGGSVRSPTPRAEGAESTSELTGRIQELEAALADTRAQLAVARASSDDQRDRAAVAREETNRLREKLAEAQRRVAELESDLRQARADCADSERRHKAAAAALAAFRERTPPPNTSEESRVIENLRRKMHELAAKNEANVQTLERTTAERDRALQEKARLQRDNDVIRVVLDSHCSTPTPTTASRALSAPALAQTRSPGPGVSSSKRGVATK